MSLFFDFGPTTWLLRITVWLQIPRSPSRTPYNSRGSQRDLTHYSDPVSNIWYAFFFISLMLSISWQNSFISIDLSIEYDEEVNMFSINFCITIDFTAQKASTVLRSRRRWRAFVLLPELLAELLSARRSKAEKALHSDESVKCTFCGKNTWRPGERLELAPPPWTTTVTRPCK